MLPAPSRGSFVYSSPNVDALDETEKTVKIWFNIRASDSVLPVGSLNIKKIGEYSVDRQTGITSCR